MYPAHGNKKFGGRGGGKKFGERKTFDRGGGAGSFVKPVMHRATCGQCGKPCEVPFKPFGNRPVFCNLCFKKDGDHTPSKFGNRDDRRPTFAPPGQRPDPSGDQWKAVNAKLDAILELLRNLD